MLEVLQKCFVHRVHPVAICETCAEKVREQGDLAPAVVVGEVDASNLAGDQIQARNPGRNREGEERVA